MDHPRRDLSLVLEAFPRERQYLLPALQQVQGELGGLPPWALAAVGEHLRVPASDLYGVATHFPELRLARHGEHLVRVCTGLGCRLLGAADILAALESGLGLRSGQTTDDGRVTLEETHCAFACAVGPIVELDGELHGAVDPAQAVTLVRQSGLMGRSR